MTDFKTWRGFARFRVSVAHKARYVREEEADEFLATLLEKVVDYEVDISAESVLWRAQIGVDWDHELETPGPQPFSTARMKPRRHRATEGRVNPKGIPVLYLATTKETAMAEVRPWKGTEISLAQFITLRDLTVVSFATDRKLGGWYRSEPDPEVREFEIWNEIDRAFSEPTERSDDRSEYVATQIIADAVRGAGYDGVAFRSGLEEGMNIALFDLDAAEVMNCCVYELGEINFEFAQAGNPYYVSRFYKDRDEETQANGT